MLHIPFFSASFSTLRIAKANSMQACFAVLSAALTFKRSRQTVAFIDSLSIANALCYLLEFARILAVCWSERKYFSSTDVSKIADKEHALPVLGNAEVF